MDRRTWVARLAASGAIFALFGCGDDNSTAPRGGVRLESRDACGIEPFPQRFRRWRWRQIGRNQRLQQLLQRGQAGEGA